MSKISTILIIDDLSSSVKMIESFLSEYEVISASSGLEGLKMVEKYMPDLILLDVIMPGMTGFEVCEILKSNDELRDIPVIFLTTLNRRDDIDKSFDLGAFDYITKPISGKALRAKIHAVFSILDKIKTKRIDDYHRKSEANEIFVKGMSHNFNNMFGGIIGMAQLLENLKVDEPKVKRYAQMIRSTSENGAKLVSQLLEFSQSSEFTFGRVNIEDIINTAVEDFKSDINRNIEINLNFNAINNITIGDKDRLLVVFKNLMRNADEAMSDNPELTLETKNIQVRDAFASKSGVEPGEFIKISVSDNGEGVSDEIRNKIFEPFFSKYDLSEARGLGLAEARGIVQGHRGTMDYYNKPTGGAEFYIYLPVGKKKINPVVGGNDNESGNVEGTILLVDDEEISLLFAKEMLRKSGYKVDTAVNGEEALELYRVNGGNIDLVLTDIIMPKLNGLELAGELIKINPDVKIIFMTGHSIDLEEKKDLKFVKGLIKKPFRGMEIINLINDALQ